MVKLDEARTYVAAHASTYPKQVLFERFFQMFETGAYVLLGPQRPFTSAEYFRRATDRLFYAYVYRFTDPDRSALRAACIGFNGRSLKPSEWDWVFKHAYEYMAKFEETDPEEGELLATIADPGRPVDGAYLIVGHAFENFTRCNSYHVTRPYLTPAQSRMLLNTALEMSKKQAQA